MKAPVTIVSSFGRSGSSLVMQMLHAAGMATTGEPPAFEHEAANIVGFDAGWIARQHGRAVKILDPHRPQCALEPGDYRAIWIDRDPREQTKSHAKFVRTFFGLDIDRAQRQRHTASLRQDRKPALATLRAAGPVLTLRFEAIINDPAWAARQIARFCDLLAIDDMAAVVRKRPTGALPDMSLELELLRETTA